MIRLRHTITIVALMVAVGLLAACKPTAEEQVKQRIAEVGKLTELGTVEYTVTKVVKANDEKWYAIGDRKILFTTTARLKAGVVLDGFGAANVAVEQGGKRAVVTLPHAELLSLTINPEDIKLVYQEHSGLRSSFSAEERNELLQQGEADIRAEATSMGLLQDAELGARQFFEALFRQAGFESVDVRFVAKKKGGAQ